MASCIICGNKVPPDRHKYCSDECMEQAKNIIRSKERWKVYVKKLREKSSFTLDDYGKLCKERDRRGLPRISYGKLQTRLYFAKERRLGRNENALVS